MNKVIGAVKYFWDFLNSSWPMVKEICYSILPLLAVAFFVGQLWVWVSPCLFM